MKKCYIKILCITLSVIIFILISMFLFKILDKPIMRIIVTPSNISSLSPISWDNIKYILFGTKPLVSTYSYMFELKSNGSLYILGGFRRADNDLTKPLYIVLCKELYKIQLSPDEISELLILAEKASQFDKYPANFEMYADQQYNQYLLFNNTLTYSVYKLSITPNMYKLMETLESFCSNKLHLQTSLKNMSVD